MVVRRRSFALIVVLVATAAVFALAVEGGLAVRAAIVEAGALRNAARLDRDARNAATLALAGLTVPATPNRASDDSLGGDAPDAQKPPDKVKPPDIPELPPAVKELLGKMLDKPQKDDPAGAASTLSTAINQRSSSGGALSTFVRVGIPDRPIEVTVDGTRFNVTMSDDAGLLNLNTADEGQLTRYFALKGFEPPLNEELAQQILDWRDADSFVHPRGAEREQYERRGVTIRNGPIRALEELLYLPSMRRDIFERIAPDVTLQGDGKVHVGSASREVLLSVEDMNPAAVQEVLRLRAAGALTSQSLAEALSGTAMRALDRLRLSPTSFVRLRVEVVGRPGTAFEGSATVDNRRGVTIESMRPIPGGEG